MLSDLGPVAAPLAGLEDRDDRRPLLGDLDARPPAARKHEPKAGDQYPPTGLELLWAHQSQRAKQWLEQGDLESAINAAAQIGDDHLQREQSGVARPDTFTHGTSAQRQRWFLTGYKSGSVAACDTFGAQSL